MSEPRTETAREPNPEAVRRILAHLWGEDLVNLRAAVESFANGWTVVPKEAAAPQPLDVERLAQAMERACDDLGVTSLCPGDAPVLYARLSRKEPSDE